VSVQGKKQSNYGSVLGKTCVYLIATTLYAFLLPLICYTTIDPRCPSGYSAGVHSLSSLFCLWLFYFCAMGAVVPLL